ncbi:hypothetical protein KIH77_08730 [Bifidobacterium sp. 82T24]|uniref:hypothetical protein n=1 Tax=Bifidobacterium pluvialisilvae TaxID=2834436 RepID=UPI001C5A1B3D|nr:hypothetical protein [Bifidobacterium pluvialisilvae]MBW3088806.1 hypothetical protein [Bifidobacterium pluvialisilvae]
MTITAHSTLTVRPPVARNLPTHPSLFDEIIRDPELAAYVRQMQSGSSPRTRRPRYTDRICESCGGDCGRKKARGMCRKCYEAWRVSTGRKREYYQTHREEILAKAHERYDRQHGRKKK